MKYKNTHSLLSGLAWLPLLLIMLLTTMPVTAEEPAEEALPMLAPEAGQAPEEAIAKRTPARKKNPARQAFFFPLHEAEEIIAEHLSLRGAGEKLELDRVRVLVPGRPYPLTFARAALLGWDVMVEEIYLLPDNRFRAILQTLPSLSTPTEPAQTLQMITIEGAYSALVELPTLLVPAPRGAVLDAQDFGSIWLPANRIRPQMIRDIESLEGKMLRRRIAANKPILLRDVALPVVVERHTPLTLRYRTRYMELKAAGIAQEAGHKGQIIRVKNTDSGQLLRAKILPDGSALVNYTTAPGPSLAMH